MKLESSWQKNKNKMLLLPLMRIKVEKGVSMIPHILPQSKLSMEISKLINWKMLSKPSTRCHQPQRQIGPGALNGGATLYQLPTCEVM